MDESANRLVRRLRLIWPGRNALVRRWDRIEAALTLVAVGLCLAAVPTAVVIGGSVYRGQSAVARQQAVERHRTIAVTTVDASGAPLTETPPSAAQVQVGAIWTGTDGAEHIAPIWVDPATPAGTAQPIWLDRDNQPVAAPTEKSAVVASAVAVALFAAFCCVLGAVMGLGAGRMLLDRRRAAAWARAWERFSGRPTRP